MRVHEVSAEIRNEFIAGYLARSAEVIHGTAECCSQSIERGAQLITECFESNGKLLICGQRKQCGGKPTDGVGADESVECDRGAAGATGSSADYRYFDLDFLCG